MDKVGVVTKSSFPQRRVGVDLEDGMVIELNGVVKADSEDVIGDTILLEKASVTKLTLG